MALKVADCRHGRLMFYDNDRFIGRCLDLYGEYSEGEVRLLQQVLRPGMTAMDVGANIGVLDGPHGEGGRALGRVLAVEPQRQLYQVLNGNLALNGLQNVMTMLGCMGAAVGGALMPAPDFRAQGINLGRLSPGEVGEPVPVATVDGLGLPELHLVKIDVEGMELEVLRGAAGTIARCRPTLYVENDRPDRSAALIGELLDMGYRLWWHLPPLVEPGNFLGRTDNVIGDFCSANMLGIHGSIEASVPLTPITSPDDVSGVRS